MTQAQAIDTFRQLRANIAATVSELDSRLFPKHGATLVGEPFILVEAQDPSRALVSLGDVPAVTLAPALLTGVLHYSREDAQKVAAKVQAAGGPALVPALARSWMLQQFDDLSRQLIQLDDLLAESAA